MYGFTLFTFLFSAPTEPLNVTAAISPPSTATGPGLTLAWERPQEMNGILIKYKLVFNNTYSTNRSLAIDVFPNTTKTYISALGGVRYHVSLSAVTIKEGPAVSLGPVVIPQYST